MNDILFMREALAEAELAAVAGEVPIGAVAVRDGVIVARAHNQVEELHTVAAHAEFQLLHKLEAISCDWRMSDYTFYITKEPCPMCAGAIVLSRVDRVVWGVGDDKRGGGSVFGIFNHHGINHHPETLGGVLEEPCRSVLQEFFRRRRAEHV